MEASAGGHRQREALRVNNYDDAELVYRTEQAMLPERKRDHWVCKGKGCDGCFGIGTTELRFLADDLKRASEMRNGRYTMPWRNSG